MHVLGLPPAFVLSQDQTLKLKAAEAAILDRRTSAHLSPGACPGNSLLVQLACASRQTVKLTLPSSVSSRNPREPICVGASVDQTKPPAYPFRYPSMSNSREKNCPQPPNLLGDNSQIIPNSRAPSPKQEPYLATPKHIVKNLLDNHRGTSRAPGPPAPPASPTFQRPRRPVKRYLELTQEERKTKNAAVQQVSRMPLK